MKFCCYICLGACENGTLMLSAYWGDAMDVLADTTSQAFQAQLECLHEGVFDNDTVTGDM